MGEMERAFMMWKILSDEGVFVNPVAPPGNAARALPHPHELHGDPHRRDARPGARDPGAGGEETGRDPLINTAKSLTG
jgi:hypothetical protein